MGLVLCAVAQTERKAYVSILRHRSPLRTPRWAVAQFPPAGVLPVYQTLRLTHPSGIDPFVGEIFGFLLNQRFFERHCVAHNFIFDWSYLQQTPIYVLPYQRIFKWFLTTYSFLDANKKEKVENPFLWILRIVLNLYFFHPPSPWLAILYRELYFTSFNFEFCSLIWWFPIDPFL